MSETLNKLNTLRDDLAGDWYLQAANDVVYGPVPFATLCEWAADGRVAPEFGLSQDRMEWRPALDFPELGLEQLMGAAPGSELLQATEERAREEARREAAERVAEAEAEAEEKVEVLSKEVDSLHKKAMRMQVLEDDAFQTTELLMHAKEELDKQKAENRSLLQQARQHETKLDELRAELEALKQQGAPPPEPSLLTHAIPPKTVRDMIKNR
jgi:hypothetical protein